MNRHRIEYILGRGEPSRSLHMIIMSAEKQVGAEIEILLPAMACDIRRVGHPKSSPQLITLVPGSDLLDSEVRHREMERCREVRPKSVPVEIRPIESVPGSIDSAILAGVLWKLD